MHALIVVRGFFFSQISYSTKFTQKENYFDGLYNRFFIFLF